MLDCPAHNHTSPSTTFDSRTVVDLSDRRAHLGIGWTVAGTTAPFLSLGEDGLVLDLDNPDIGLRHHIHFGGVVLDLFDLPASPQIVPPTEGRTRYAILQRGRIQIFSDFAEFAVELSLLLDGVTAARALHAGGGYDAASNVFTTYKLAIILD